jgi:hypothetical protein
MPQGAAGFHDLRHYFIPEQIAAGIVVDWGILAE